MHTRSQLVDDGPRESCSWTGDDVLDLHRIEDDENATDAIIALGREAEAQVARRR